MYLQGKYGTKADNQTAFRYFKQAADQGDAAGLSYLGMMYVYGYGVEPDVAEVFTDLTSRANAFSKKQQK